MSDPKATRRRLVSPPPSAAQIINAFYVVTLNAIYRIAAGEQSPLATLLAIRDQTSRGDISVAGAQFIAIMKSVIVAFRTEDGSKAVPDEVCRNVIPVPDGYRAGQVVALFLTEDEALDCFQRLELTPSDRRWAAETAMLAIELSRHPMFIVDL